MGEQLDRLYWGSDDSYPLFVFRLWEKNSWKKQVVEGLGFLMGRMGVVWF